MDQNEKQQEAAQETNAEKNDLTQELPQLLCKIVERAALLGASDIHFHAGEKPAIRVNGEIQDMDLPKMNGELLEKLIISSGGVKLVPGEKQDIDHAMNVPGVGRVRINAFLNRGEGAMVMRIIKDHIPSMSDLEVNHAGIIEMLKKERGIILVTGPTGSGKTTTLAAMIDQLNQENAGVIITIEDPIEVIHPNKRSKVAQREVGRDTKSFASGMRAALREDPDVILIGEMRDEETVEAAIKAAMTGHLVLSTLHTQDAVRTINRIIDFFPPHARGMVRTQMSESLVGVISQRLVQRQPSGRVAALEILINTSGIKDAIKDDKTDQITELIERNPLMQSFDTHLTKLVANGVISYASALESASSVANLKINLQQLGLTDARLKAFDQMPYEERLSELHKLTKDQGIE